MKRYLIVVHGLVQGVGFRFFTYKEAQFHNITGWVKNCSNGTVKIEAQGQQENLINFISSIKKGSFFSDVEEIYTKNIDINIKENSFKMLL